MSTNLLCLLPEVILTITGVIVMLAEPMIAARQDPQAPRLARHPRHLPAAAASHLVSSTSSSTTRWAAPSPPSTRPSRSITSPSSSTSSSPQSSSSPCSPRSTTSRTAPSPTPASTSLSVCFGATGMMFMTSSVELLMVFIGLEISSISTYILAGFRKGRATASESSIKYFLLGSFATAFFLYGIALCFGATGSTSIAAIAAGMAGHQDPNPRMARRRHGTHRPRLQGLRRPLPRLDARRLSRRPCPRGRLNVHRPQSRRLRRAAPLPLQRHSDVPQPLDLLIEILAVASMCIGNLGALLQRDVKRMLAYSSIAHAGYILVAFTASESDAVAAACFYSAAYAAMNVGAFVVLTQLSGVDEKLRSIDDFTGLALRRPGLSALLGFFLISLDRHSLHRRLLRQVLRLLRRRPRRPHLACHRRPGQLRRRLLLLPAPAHRPLQPPPRPTALPTSQPAR